jgi:hypothetical protein
MRTLELQPSKATKNKAIIIIKNPSPKKDTPRNRFQEYLDHRLLCEKEWLERD